MAKCKQCNVDIPEGLDYCDNCVDDNQSSTDEFYLDNLLNMVVNNKNEDAAINSESFFSKNDVASERSDKGDIAIDRVESSNEMKDDLISDWEEDNYTDAISEDLFSIMQEHTTSSLETSDNLVDVPISANNNYQDEVTYDLDDNSFDTDEDLLNLLDKITGENATNEEPSNIAPAEEINQKDIIDTIDTIDTNGNSQEIDYQLDSIDQMIPVDNTTSELNDTNQMYHDDILAIDELLGSSGLSMDFTSDTLGNSLNIPDDVGKVFSDVVSAVDSLADVENNNSTSTPAVQKLNTELNNILENAADKSKSTKKEKKNFLQKLFGKDSSDDVLNDSEKQNVKRNKKANQNSQKDTKAANKNQNSENAEPDGKSSKKSKWTLKGNKKVDSKKVSKPKKQKSTLKVVQEYDDLEDSNKKINKAAVIFIFTCISALCLFIIIGSKTYSYSLGIKNATTNFERKRYTQAYNDIYGTNVKKKDIDIYNKIITVMYVNKQLNSYNNNYTMGKYPEALDSLLKGLERYDKYIAKAKKLGIKSDLDYVRNQILGELESKYNISEKEAEGLNQYSDQAQYSIEVINATSKN